VLGDLEVVAADRLDRPVDTGAVRKGDPDWLAAPGKVPEGQREQVPADGRAWRRPREQDSRGTALYRRGNLLVGVLLASQLDLDPIGIVNGAKVALLPAPVSDLARYLDTLDYEPNDGPTPL